jgi:rubrerythrin
MALPKLDVPIYELELPSTGESISYRPFLVKEEKILLMAMEGEDEREITTAIKQIINNCILSENLKVSSLPLFDIEYILLNLRARSMGDTIKTSYMYQDCKEENCKPVELEIDVNSIQIEKDENHTTKIELTDSVGIIMKYPDIEMMSKMNNLTATETSEAFDLIVKCIDQIYDDETVYSKADYTPKQLKEFVEGLTQDQFRKIEQFFNTIPKMYKDVEFKCDKCGYTEDMRLEGLASFFG